MQKRRLLASAALAITALGCGATSLSRTAGAAESPKQAPADNRRIAVVYFTKTGNTKSLAEAVRHMTGAALFRVETVEPYPESYGSATEIVKDELQRGVIRPIRPLAFNPDDYDVVVLATPTWWHHAAMPLQTWIRSVDLSAKKILTANTHGGGGLMHTREAFEALLAGRRLGTALFRVETVEPYPESYGSATEIVKDELQRGVIRPIRPLAFNPDDYDVVVLATPTWWHHAAMPLQTWIRSVDLSAKKILTANTHGGGGLMHTREAFEALLAGRRLGTHLTVYGAVRPQDAKVRKTAVSDARNTITDRNPTWRGLNLPTV